MLLRVNINDDTALVSGWDRARLETVGTEVSGLTDQSDGSTTNIDLVVDTPFAAFAGTTLVDQDHHGWPQGVWQTTNYSRQEDSDPSPVFRLTGGSDLVVGQDYLIEIAGAWDEDNDVEFTVNGTSEVYDNTAQSKPITPTAPVEITVAATDDGSGNGELVFTAGFSTVGDRNFLTAFTVTEANTGPSITSVTDSVGSTADRVTSGASADIALDGGIGATQGTVDLEDSTGTYIESGTINSWDDSTNTITTTFTQSANRFGDTDNVIRVTLDDSTEITYSGVTFAAPTGTYYVNGSSPDTTSDFSVFFDAVSAPTGDHQIVWRDPNDVAGTTTTEKQNLIDADGTVDDVAQKGDIFVKAWDATDGTTSTEVTFTAEFTAEFTLSIDDAATDNAAYPGETVTANVSGDLGATPGTMTLEDSGGNEVVSQTVIDWDNTNGSSGTVDFTVEQGGLPFASDHVLTVTTDGGTSATLTFELGDEPGNAHVDVSNPDTSDDSIFAQVTNGTPVTGQQIEYTDAANTMVSLDGTFTQSVTQDFSARVWNTDYTWSAWTTITVDEAEDTAQGSVVAQSLLPAEGTSRLVGSMSLGPTDQPFKLSARGLPKLQQSVRVTYGSFAANVEQRAFRLPQNAQGLRVYAVVRSAFNDGMSNELRVVNDQGVVAALDLSSAGIVQPTTLSLPSTSDAQDTLSVQWQVTDTDATQGEAHVFFEYIYKAE